MLMMEDPDLEPEPYVKIYIGVREKDVDWAFSEIIDAPATYKVCEI